MSGDAIPYTAELRLCDDQGVVSMHPISEVGATRPAHLLGPMEDSSYLARHNRLALLRQHPHDEPTVTEPFCCTGQMIVRHDLIRCTSPAHVPCPAPGQTYGKPLGTITDVRVTSGPDGKGLQASIVGPPWIAGLDGFVPGVGGNVTAQGKPLAAPLEYFDGLEAGTAAWTGRPHESARPGCVVGSVGHEDAGTDDAVINELQALRDRYNELYDGARPDVVLLLVPQDRGAETAIKLRNAFAAVTDYEAAKGSDRPERWGRCLKIEALGYTYHEATGARVMHVRLEYVEEPGRSQAAAHRLALNGTDVPIRDVRHYTLGNAYEGHWGLLRVPFNGVPTLNDVEVEQRPE